MIRPILACKDPYKAAEEFAAAGWNIDFSQPPESGDPLVGLSLCGNSVLLGVTEGYVADERCGDRHMDARSGESASIIYLRMEVRARRLLCTAK